MQILQLPRAGGKTTAAIQTSALSGIQLVTRDEQAVKQLIYQADRMGLKIPTPTTYREVINRGRESQYSGEILIDDLDLFFQAMRLQVVGATLTPTVEKIIPRSNYFEGFEKGWHAGYNSKLYQ